MIKKVLIVLLCLFLSGCNQKQEIKEIEYIDPVKDVFIFSELDNALKYRIQKANLNKEFENYQFKMLFKDVFDKTVKDINDNDVDLKGIDNLVVEVVSVKCEHCRKQIHNVQDFIKDGVTFVQYFNVGRREDILKLYEEEGVSVPENLICIGESHMFDDYLRNNLKIKQYPTLLCFKEGKNTFSVVGEINSNNIDNIYDIAFNDYLTEDDFVYDGINVIDTDRGIDDVIASLSEENKKALESIDNDGHTCDLTYKYIGKKIDLDDMNNGAPAYYSEVEDFTVMNDDKYILLYTQLDNNNDDEKIDFINSLINKDDKYKYIVVLNEGAFSSSQILSQNKNRFNCPVVSNLGKIPHNLQNIPIGSYPSAVFVDYGVITGIYSNISDEDNFVKALDLFLSEKSIAYKDNN